MTEAGSPYSIGLHPIAWWVWALGLAAGASMTTNPIMLLSLILAASFVVVMCRGDHTWARSFRLYLLLALAIVLIRVLFRIVFGSIDTPHVIVNLPQIGLPSWAAGIRLFGPITVESLLAGLYDGLRLAAIVVCAGAANSLANPKRLLKSAPPALHEIGTALVVAVSVLPQLAQALRRVRSAQALRGGRAASGRVRGLRRIVVPVLEDALESSIRLAASMDARGYGRSGGLTKAERFRTGAMMMIGLLGICMGSYAVLDQTAPRFLAAPMLLAGVAMATLGMWSAGRRVSRTRYRPDPWRARELVVIALAVAVAGLLWWVSKNQPSLAYPELTAVPTIGVLGLVAVVLGVLPGLVAPSATRVVTR